MCMSANTGSSRVSFARQRELPGGEAGSEIIESPSGGALWRAYLTSVLSKPIIKEPIIEEEAGDEVQTAA